MSNDLRDSISISVSGSFTLLVGNSVALLFSAIGVILVARMLSPSEFGLLSIILVLPGMFSLFSDWGVNQALIRYIAHYRSIGKVEDIKDLVMAGVLFKFLIGGILSLFLFLFGNFFAVFLIKRPEVGGFIRLASLFVLSQSMYSTAISIFAGFEKMNYRAAINVIQSVVKGVVSPLLVYLGFGVSGVVIGHVLSFFVGAFIGLISTHSLFNLSMNLQNKRVKENLLLLLMFGLPLFFGNIFLGIALQIRWFLLSWFVSAETIGNYSIASWFIIAVSVFTASIGVNLFPTFSKYAFKDEPKKVKEIFRGSVRYASIFLIPLISLLILISKPLIFTIFSGKFPQAPLLLSLRLMPTLFVGIGSLSIFGFLNSQGDTRVSSRIIIISSIISVLLSIIFIYLWSVIGLVVSILLSSFIQNLLGLIVIRRKYDIGPDLSHTFKTLMCSFISGVVTYGFLYIFKSLSIVDLFFSVVIFLMSYLLIAPFIGAIEAIDVQNLDLMFKELKMIYPFAKLVLDFEGRILRLKFRARE